MCPNYTPADHEAASHDKYVRDYSDETILSLAEDLGKRRAHERKNPEHRWIMGRRAALHREIIRRRLNR